MKNELDLFQGSFWNPMREYADLQRGINRLFEDFGWLAPQGKGRTEIAIAPACDVEESEGQYHLSLDLPGVKKEDIKVEINDKVLVISGERKDERKEDKKSRHIVERYYGGFQRVVSLPTSVNADQIQASFENGVLKVAIPKMEVAKSKQIKITDGKTATSSSSTSAASGTPKTETRGKDGNAPVRVA